MPAERVLQFHHIKSSTKRRHIQKWASEHGLKGAAALPALLRTPLSLQQACQGRERQALYSCKGRAGRLRNILPESEYEASHWRQVPAPVFRGGDLAALLYSYSPCHLVVTDRAVGHALEEDDCYVDGDASTCRCAGSPSRVCDVFREDGTADGAPARLRARWSRRNILERDQDTAEQRVSHQLIPLSKERTCLRAAPLSSSSF